MGRLRSSSQGSSPHARGALRHDQRRALHLGIIPAYAGSTCGIDVLLNLSWDHPRIRGEHQNREQPD